MRVRSGKSWHVGDFFAQAPTIINFFQWQKLVNVYKQQKMLHPYQQLAHLQPVEETWVACDFISTPLDFLHRETRTFPGNRSTNSGKTPRLDVKT